MVKMKNTLDESRIPLMGLTVGQTQLRRELVKYKIDQKKIPTLKYKTKAMKSRRGKDVQGTFRNV